MVKLQKNLQQQKTTNGKLAYRYYIPPHYIGHSKMILSELFLDESMFLY